MRFALYFVILAFICSCTATQRAPVIEIIPEEREVASEKVDTVDIDVFSEFPVAEISIEEEVATSGEIEEEQPEQYNFSIQIGAFSNYKNADELRQEAGVRLSYEVFIEIEDLLYKVRAGRFRDKIDAENVLDRIKQVYKNAFLVELK